MPRQKSLRPVDSRLREWRQDTKLQPNSKLGCSTMIQFVTYFVCGFCVVWLNLFMWGFSNGPVNTIPYFSAIGSLLLFIVVAPLALFLSRIAAVAALVCATLIVPQPAFILLREGSLTGFTLFGVFPTVAGIVGLHHLWKTRGEKLLAARSSTCLSFRVPLALLPVAIFVFAFDARRVLSLLLEGAPQ